MRRRAALPAWLWVALVACDAGAVPSAHPGTARASDYWGMSVSLHPALSAARGFAYPPPLGPVADLGARAVIFPVVHAQYDAHSSALSPGPAEVTHAELRAAIRAAHARGLHSALLPIVTLRAGGPRDWRGRLSPADPDAWFDSYGRFVSGLARLAAQEEVGMLVVGSELSSLSGGEHLQRWARLCRRVRARYSGLLAFAVNHDALDLDEVAPLVDVWGVSAYFPLTDAAAPRLADLRAGWARVLPRLRALRARVGRPLILMELGYPSRGGAAARPWDDSSGTPTDLALQRAAYHASAEAVASAPFIDGALYWTWLGPGGPHDRHYTPRGKPAEAELRWLLRTRGRGGTLALRGGSGAGGVGAATRPR